MINYTTIALLVIAVFALFGLLIFLQFLKIFLIVFVPTFLLGVVVGFYLSRKFKN